MIDAKQAVQIAMQQAAGMLNRADSNVEEIERDDYKGREVWSITLSFPRNVPQDMDQLHPLARLWGLLQYKRFLIDVETGDVVAIKLREMASR